MHQLVERFLSYVTFDTTSDDTSITCPSTSGQRLLADHIQDELIAMGLSVTVDTHGYVMAKLPLS